MAPFMPNMQWTDLNGIVWNLSAPGTPLKLRAITGLEGADWDFDTSTGVGQPGVTVHARDDKESIVEMELQVGPVEPGDAAVGLLRRIVDGFGRGWSRNGRLGEIRCRDTERFQAVRLAEVIRVDWVQMHHAGLAQFEVKLMSDESWWRTRPFDKTFTPAEWGQAKVDNRGDEPAWMWMRIDGPITHPTIGVDGEQVTIPLTVGAGQWLEVETDPDLWVVRDHTGTDRTWNVGERWRRQVPARTRNAPLHISGTGTGAATEVRVVVPQLFHGAI